MEKAVGASVRVMKEGVMDAVKIEGGNKAKIDAIKGVYDMSVCIRIDINTERGKADVLICLCGCC